MRKTPDVCFMEKLHLAKARATVLVCQPAQIQKPRTRMVQGSGAIAPPLVRKRQGALLASTKKPRDARLRAGRPAPRAGKSRREQASAGAGIVDAGRLLVNLGPDELDAV